MNITDDLRFEKHYMHALKPWKKLRKYQILRIISDAAKACPCDIALSQTYISVWKLVTVSADYHISEQHRVRLVYERKKD